MAEPDPFPVNLAGENAVVTGGGRGIGQATARRLASAGASVAVVARTDAQLAQTVGMIREEGGRAIAVVADVADPRSVERMASDIQRELGDVDLLVNNAGDSGPFGPVSEIDAEHWWRCQEVNLRGPFLASRAFLPGMLARGGGRIVNVASGAGTFAIPYLSAYVVSKTALIRLTEALAAEVAAQGVRVFAIEPGTVRTAMLESVLKSDEGRRWLPWFQDIIANGQDVPPDRAGELVAWLASGRADALSGRFFTINDDLGELTARAERGALDDLQTLRLRTAGPG